MRETTITKTKLQIAIKELNKILRNGKKHGWEKSNLVLDYDSWELQTEVEIPEIIFEETLKTLLKVFNNKLNLINKKGGKNGN